MLKIAITLFGGTLAGSTTGSITHIQSVTIAGLTIDRLEYSEAGDTNAVTYSIPGKVSDGPMSVTLTYDKTLQATLRAKALSRATDTFTYTDSEGSTVAGTGFFTACSSRNSGTDGPDTFDIEISPTTTFAFTAAS